MQDYINLSLPKRKIKSRHSQPSQYETSSKYFAALMTRLRLVIECKKEYSHRSKGRTYPLSFLVHWMVSFVRMAPSFLGLTFVTMRPETWAMSRGGSIASSTLRGVRLTTLYTPQTRSPSRKFRLSMYSLAKVLRSDFAANQRSHPWIVPEKLTYFYSVQDFRRQTRSGAGLPYHVSAHDPSKQLFIFVTDGHSEVRQELDDFVVVNAVSSFC